MSAIVKTSVNDLEFGMYVSDLDRPWLETPFLLQGFHIESKEDISILCEFCEYVYVDLARSRGVPAQQKTSSQGKKAPIETIFPGRQLSMYADKSTWKDELPRARKALDNLSQNIKDIFSQSEQTFTLDVAKIKQSVDPMVDSITRNPDACIWLARIKKSGDDYIYRHSLGCSIWAVALGRQLGLPKEDLNALAIGSLLFDVGKLKVDRILLADKKRLTPKEFEKVKQHVSIGLDMLKKSGGVSKDILDMVAYHHERHDGGGYPNGLAGNDIPVFARIAAIVDCYDAITSQRHFAKALAPTQAIKKLNEWKGKDFQTELVEEFVQAVGIYPAGTVVKLSSGEIAIVVAEYRSRRLRPNVMLLLDAAQNPINQVAFINLQAQTHTSDGQPLDIVESVNPADYNIDMAAIDLAI